MALEPYSGSDYQLQNQVQDQELVQSNSDSNLSQTENSSVSGSSANLPSSVAQTLCQSVQFIPGDINISMHSNTPNSGMSIEEISLITDSNSPLSGPSYMPSTGSNSTDSLASNCDKISHSSPGNDQSSQRHIYRADQTCPQWCKRQLIMPAYHASVPLMMNFKKPRLEIRQSYDPDLAAITLQQHLLQNQNQTSISLPKPQMLHIQPLRPQQLSRDSQKQMTSGIYVSRLMCYMYHQRRRPPDNNIGYWRKFIEEYYSPCAKKRWCLSKFDNVGRHAQGVFSQPVTDDWKCDSCGSKSRKGFEATFEVLPRLNKIYFDSGVIDELLYLDFPIERRLPSGFMILWFGKAVIQSIYKDFRVVHEGQLRVIFTQELKIISWEFCVKSHEAVVPRRLVAAQGNELVENAARCRSNTDAKGTNEVPMQDLLTNCNKLAAAGHELARKLELPLINDVGFSKQFVRCLQISEVLNCMKDLIGYSHRNNLSPIETLKRYPQEYTYAKFNTSHAELQRAYMQHTQSPDWSNLTDASITCSNPHNNVHVPNLMLQTPIGRDPGMSSMNYYQRLVVDQPALNQYLYTKAPSRTVLEDNRMINELLEMMCTEDVVKEQRRNGKGKRRFVYDPNIEGGQSVPDGMQARDVSSGYILRGMVDKGKGFTSSSTAFPDFEEDYVSRARSLGLSKNDHHD